jgi:hypothetical protein
MKAYHIAKADDGRRCDCLVNVRSVESNWLRTWLCGEPAAFVIQQDDQSWRKHICIMHAYMEWENLKTETDEESET